MEKNIDACKELMRIDMEFDRITSTKREEGWASFFAENGIMVPAKGDVIRGPEEIKKSMAPAFGMEEFSLRWTPTDAEVSDDGTLGFTYGEYIRKLKNKDGQIIEATGRYTSIWRKQQDGSWKIVLDIGN